MFSVELEKTKTKKFDFGSEEPTILMECKSHA
jgi:hypothetical protein